MLRPMQISLGGPPVICVSSLGAVRWLIVALIFLPVATGWGDEPAPAVEPLAADQEAYFERHVRPLLVERCHSCHSGEADTIEGGLRLDSRDAVRRGGDSGPAVVPGDPEQSRLVRAVRYTDPLLQMPPDGKLSPREVETLVNWVRMGAPDPRVAGSEATRPGNPVRGGTDPRAVAGDWWSFQRLTDPRVPSVTDSEWPLTELDYFVLAQLEARGMRPAPPADRRTLIRRVTFDLTGLPPSPTEIDDFVADESPDALARLVDRLLASPAYGERWGRHWLDVVRYADTSGCNGDFPVAEAYRYRNYVIDSFQTDKPYDEFIREQLAGDLLSASCDPDRFENHIATGYLAISRRFSSLGEEFHLTLDDTLDNLGKAIMGLTISCARCHDHKFDPIPQADYYALYGIFQSTKYSFPGTEIYRHTQDQIPLVSAERFERELREPLSRMAKLDADIFATYTAMAAMDTGEAKNKLRAAWKKMQDQRDALVKSLPPVAFAYGATEGEPTAARVHIKGDPKNLGDEIPRGFLQALGGGRLPADATGSGRLQLAEWLVGPTRGPGSAGDDAAGPADLTPAQSLVARVIVNRVWLHHFGRGIVRTPDDFGTRGEPPTHPELLDFLARRFVEEGWSFHALHRLILLSRTYQSACVEHPGYAEADPDNRWLWTFHRLRLDAEEIRDAMLSVSGMLDASRGGRHPFPPEVEWRYTQHRPFVDDYPTRRRSVYLMQQRIRQQPFLAIFDGADTNAATGLRKTSTVAPQALFMMNSEFVHEQAAALADRVCAAGSDERARLEAAFRLVLGRWPDTDELQEGLDYLNRLRGVLGAGEEQGGAATERAAWASYLRVLLSSNEFLFVD